MNAVRRVNQPPAKPLMIYDGECGFCRRWIARWKRVTGDRVDFAASQTDHVRSNFPELTQAQLDEAFHLILPDGSVLFGAEAVLASLSSLERCSCLLRWYRGNTAFARFSEWCYHFVAKHRRFFSFFS